MAARHPRYRVIRTTAALFLTSATVLFVELLLIRWVPANVVYVGFFNNFVLLASFLGIGVGILLGRRWPALAAAFGPLLLALVGVVSLAQLNARDPAAELFLGVSERAQFDVNVAVLVAVVALTTATTAALAVPLGPLLRAMPPLRAYAVDIVGSLAGIAAFALLAALRTPPLVWFALAVLAHLGRERVSAPVPRRGVGAVALLGALALVSALHTQGDRYSPYYRISLYREASGDESIFVNGIPLQTLWPARSERKEPFYEQLYRWYPERRFAKALVIGAGAGTDTALALAHGVARVDAVEIDPEILAIGQERHPDRPYGDRRVRLVVNDGRAYLRANDERYDLIVLAQTDSLTLVSATANLRLESFLFTEEAFASVRDHLTPDGVFVLYNYYRERWLVERYAAMLQRVFGTPPLLRTYPQFGEVQAAFLVAGPGLGELPTDREPLAVDGAPRASTDDWPFPYLREPRIVPRYVTALALLVAFAAIAVAGAGRTAGLDARLFSPHFFALGAAFLLLETKSLVTFSLLFGTTWLVNALVFFAILTSVLAAIAVTARFPVRNPRPLYLVLFASLVAAYLLPPSALLFEPAALRYALASALAFAPIFFANLVFARSFRDTRAADTAFASNLLGAMAGGLLEWAALLTGYQALLLVVAGLYALAYLLRARWRVLADRDA